MLNIGNRSKQGNVPVARDETGSRGRDDSEEAMAIGCDKELGMR